MADETPSSPESLKWTNLRASAMKEGTKPSVTTSQAITPSLLLGSYSSVWDSHVCQEALDDLTDEVSWLHLTVDSAVPADATTATSPGKSVPQNQPSEPTFGDIQGHFKWWRMVGSFKGLYRPENANENIWLFGGLKWRYLTNEEGHSPGDEDEDPTERNQDDFGLAALVTLDDSGKPFLEMLYNATLYYQKERASRNKTTPGNSKQPTGSDRPEYIRVLWKKLEVDGNVSWIDLSDKEAKRVWRYASIDLSVTRHWNFDVLSESRDADDDPSTDVDDDSSEDEKEEADASIGVKRAADEGAEDTPDKATKRLRV
ncbi:hypothetical protein CPB84DRAFT_1794141 [Gymnopilus junonius]|uniref:Uncharacterized protein n=1 Tax=Gymnopilus junonius TaxID=109634 RepID=A0A9P5NCB7_GYMJU|nr:hypothetical protein CPB84DRAFT_1794141 [Gymnopilus junonius]